MDDNNLLIDILKNQVTPALGCTEPGAVAYAVAKAKEILDDEVKKLNITVNTNILKNGLGVGIPGTDERGIVFAAALALVIGKSEYVLEVLKDTNKDSIQKAHDIVNSKIINLELDKDADSLYISVEAFGRKDKSKVIIKDAHTNIVFQSKNDEILMNNDYPLPEQAKESNPSNEIKYKIKKFSFDNLIDFANNVPLNNILFIQDGIDMNLLLADVGLNDNIGIGMGKYLNKNVSNVYSKAKAYTAAASEARMSGYPLPVMSSAGSGNHGLVAITPISVIGNDLEKSREKIIRSVTLSHLVTIYVKVQIGALSPVCGCGVAAGVGCAAGLTYLRDGNINQIKNSIKTMIAGVTGMICDGAKLGCSYKLAIAVDSAVDASNMALEDIFIPSDNGILSESAEKTIENLAEISNVGMKNTDSTILNIMLSWC
jgi:L-cysteine desulfidase